MEAVFEFLTSDVGVKAAIYVVGLLFGFVKGLKWIKDKKLVVAAQSLEAGVEAVYQTYIKGLKAGREDGKLTEDEKSYARDLAIQKAKEFAAEEGVDLLKVYGAMYLPVLVEKLVKRSKTAGAIAGGILPFVPGVPPLSPSEVQPELPE